MSDAKTKRSTPAEQEAALMDSAEEMFEKSASALSAEDQEKFGRTAKHYVELSQRYLRDAE